VCGVPVGRYLESPISPNQITLSQDSSIMIVLGTDAPLHSRQLRRLCVRAGAGLARVGGRYHHGSGDFVIAFSTATKIAHSQVKIVKDEPVLTNDGDIMDGLFQAVIESVEEAILNSLTCAKTMVGRDRHVAHALPLGQVVKLCSNIVE
jgi:D-aminopeptidase